MSFIEKAYGQTDAGLSRYVEKVFRPEEDLYTDIRARCAAAEMPDIHVSPFDALHLEVLSRAIGAKLAVEIGTLGGYSAVSIARGLAEGGHLHTLEIEPKHAEVAEETFRRAKVDDRVQIHVGPALETLQRIEEDGPFDLVFLDADKAAYPRYLAWAEQNLRIGGVVLADNAFAWGQVLDDAPGPDALGIIAFNHRLANGGRFRATMLPTGEGLAMGVKVE